MNEEKKFAEVLQSTGPYLTLGAQLAITVVVFFFIGKYADEYFETKPWLMVSMIIVGAIGGLIKFFRTVIDLSNKEENERRNKI
ncbi:MAG: AtpZ/AtpI family protein [Ignavibacteriales bacterium]|nr:AtpZ/AtpI family protein [Ignavibacteriales bacterium]